MPTETAERLAAMEQIAKECGSAEIPWFVATLDGSMGFAFKATQQPNMQPNTPWSFIPWPRTEDAPVHHRTVNPALLTFVSKARPNPLALRYSPIKESISCPPSPIDRSMPSPPPTPLPAAPSVTIPSARASASRATAKTAASSTPAAPPPPRPRSFTTPSAPSVRIPSPRTKTSTSPSGAARATTTPATPPARKGAMRFVDGKATFVYEE